MREGEKREKERGTALTLQAGVVEKKEKRKRKKLIGRNEPEIEGLERGGAELLPTSAGHCGSAVRGVRTRRTSTAVVQVRTARVL